MSGEITGMLLVGGAGILAAALAFLQVVLTDWKLPYYSLFGTAELLLALALAIIIAMTGELSKIDSQQWKWVLLRGFIGSWNFTLTLLALTLGAPLGDVSALGTINVVFAALFGLMFLGEQLNKLHVTSVVLSLVGAVLVSKPDALFQSDASVPWAGYLLALGAGLLNGAMFIAARKSQGTSSLVLSCSVCAQEGVVQWIIVLTGLVKEDPVHATVSTPGLTCASLAVLMLVTLVYAVAMNAGSQMCPAVISSTIFTSVQMTLGYLAQTFYQREPPQVITMLGAVLMLLAVLLMAVGRSKTSTTSNMAEDRVEPECLESEFTSYTSDIVARAPSTESLASFIAAEFAGLSLSSANAIRLRSTVQAVTVGAASA
eukprot:CAMPEP_0197688262 /NCGR_PEP_ID=MMETSP1338-20131121/105170_1 /TAXON_ID=43686 ORGANISM="Pelagodinium beii, Strain RCC1491" /NCGR_SAMPLE_ID=MMETSP1338 /ASSEMBLY_ACC=CAM_ASM_000754 /LENGTH=372 /DNA_ID=CAMNT_0043270455 /DNA_START=20 /DNA_END=1138 /DNA_ORIENTATION=+